MRLALLGYGAMGQLVGNLARAGGDEVGLTLTSSEASQSASELATTLHGHEVAIDFSTADAVLRNVEACARAGLPLVEGTTGWQKQEADVRRIVKDHEGALVYGANFSVGVNVFYRIATQAARLMAGLDQYGVFIEEAHHVRKRDAPSGTALKLKDILSQYIKAEIPVVSLRAGHIPGTHRIGFDSAADQITLTHMARSREGFAAGALLAAHWISSRKGVFEFAEVIADVLKPKTEA
jgi:4-hydroxy-tetrahydrodipicolinate reductase